MATRRPPVPKAKFPAGIGSAPKPSPEQNSTEPVPDNSAAGAEPENPGRAGGTSGARDGKSGRGARKERTPVRERKPASNPENRAPRDGIVRSADNSPVPARSFSGRLLVVGVVMAVVTVLLAPNVHTFLQQRTEISALQADIANKQAQQGAHEAELARWDDPAYIKRQARDRVSMLMPGETGYWVYGADGVAEQVPAGKTGGESVSAKDATSITTEPWVDGLWNAIQESAKVAVQTEAPAAPPAPAPPADPAPADPAQPADPPAEPAPAG